MQVVYLPPLTLAQHQDIVEDAMVPKEYLAALSAYIDERQKDLQEVEYSQILERPSNGYP